MNQIIPDTVQHISGFKHGDFVLKSNLCAVRFPDVCRCSGIMAVSDNGNLTSSGADNVKPTDASLRVHMTDQEQACFSRFLRRAAAKMRTACRRG